MTRLGLSKSRIMNGLQCPKLLWVQVHEPERITYPRSLQRIFDMGHAVGAVAQAQHPDGVLIGAAEQAGSGRPDMRAALAETRELLSRNGDVTLFEATFEHDGVLVRTDLLFRERGRVRFTEVKSSTSVKDEHVPDAAIQAWVLQQSGVPVEQVRIGHVDNTFVYQGDGDYSGLLVEEDVTEAVTAKVPEVEGWVTDLRRILTGGMPEVFVGSRCRTPHVCPLYDWCRECDGDVHVGYLPGSNALVEQLQSEGYVRLRDVPPGRITGRDQARVWEATVAGRAQLDPAIRAELRALPYPRYYFDFETINFAVPIWAGTRPWEQLPFQFSCDVETAPGVFEHREFLDLSGILPAWSRAHRRSLDQLGDGDGPVLVYHAPFERTVLATLQRHVPESRRAAAGRHRPHRRPPAHRQAPLLPPRYARVMVHQGGPPHRRHPTSTTAPSRKYTRAPRRQMAYEEAIGPHTTCPAPRADPPQPAGLLRARHGGYGRLVGTSSPCEPGHSLMLAAGLFRSSLTCRWRSTREGTDTDRGPGVEVRALARVEMLPDGPPEPPALRRSGRPLRGEARRCDPAHPRLRTLGERRA